MDYFIDKAAEHGHCWYFLAGVVVGLLGRFALLVLASSGSSDSWDD